MPFARGYTPWNKGRVVALADRFWPWVDKSGDCWTWTGALFGGTGYGSLYAGAERGNVGAHRVSWELHFGPVPAGLLVCHHCDNRPCVRPEHLFLGTSADNSADMYRKGRSVQQTKPHLLARGEQVNTARLTEDKVRQIRSLHASGRTIRSLAREYEIAQTAIQGVVRRRSWRHVV